MRNGTLELQVGKWAVPTHTAAVRETTGATARDIAGSNKVPFEKEQWILREMRKFGRSREVCTDKWKKKVQETHASDNDHCGDDGQLRLWLR